MIATTIMISINVNAWFGFVFIPFWIRSDADPWSSGTNPSASPLVNHAAWRKFRSENGNPYGWGYACQGRGVFTPLPSPTGLYYGLSMVSQPVIVWSSQDFGRHGIPKP